MYQVQHQSVANAIESDSRCFRALLDFGDFQVEDVGQIKWSKGSTQDDKPCIGSVVSTQGEMQIITIPEGYAIQKDMEFQLYIYLYDYLQGTYQRTWNDLADYTFNDLADYTYYNLGDIPAMAYELIPIGKFTVLSCKYKSDYYAIEFTDRLSFADKEYKPRLEFDNGWESSDDVMTDICSRLGITAEIEADEGYLCDEDGNRIVSSDGYYIVTSPFQFYMRKPDGYTIREVLSHISAMRGKFAVMDRNGTLIQRWYSERSTAMDIDEEKRYMDNIEMEFEDAVTPGTLLCHIDDDRTLQTGADTENVMEFECPYMTKQRLKQLHKQVREYYYPANFTQVLGDPRLDLWDRFYKIIDGSAEPRHILMLNMDYTFDGGLMIDIDS